MAPFVHKAPKYLTFALTLPFLPKARDDMIPFLFIGMSLCLGLHHFAPRKVIVPLTSTDVLIISMNLAITAVSALFFLHVAGDKIVSVKSYTDIPPIEFTYMPLWVLVEETIFFFLHRALHQPGIYDKCHKWHHHFKVTSAWTSFYAHPFDQLVSVVWSALGLPLLMCLFLPNGITAPTLTLFFFGAIVTFIGSHHAVKGHETGHAVGSNHLEHHMKFNVNFGNFGYFDKLTGSFGEAKIKA